MNKRLSRFLPSKKFIAVLVPVICAVIGISIWSFISPKQKTTSNQILTLNTPQQDIREVDTDGDGLKDWQESLWGTQVSQKDTDGDGTSDGDEVKANRNPTIPGPDDKQLTAENALPLLADAALAADSDDEPQTQTDIISKLLLGQAINIQNGSAPADPTSIYQILQSIQSQNIQKNTASIPQIGPSDLTIVSTTPDSLKKYGNDLGTILSGTPTEETNELLVLGKFGQTKDVTVLSKLNVVSQSYTSLIQELSAIPIPQSAAEAHIAFINSLAGISVSIKNMTLIATDPLAGVFALQSYAPYAQKRNESFKEIQSILNTSGIVFASNEPGYTIISADTQKNVQQ